MDFVDDMRLVLVARSVELPEIERPLLVELPWVVADRHDKVKPKFLRELHSFVDRLHAIAGRARAFCRIFEVAAFCIVVNGVQSDEL